MNRGGSARPLHVTVMITADGTIIGCAAAGGKRLLDFSERVPHSFFFSSSLRKHGAYGGNVVARARAIQPARIPIPGKIRYDLHLVFRALSARPN